MAKEPDRGRPPPTPRREGNREPLSRNIRMKSGNPSPTTTPIHIIGAEDRTGCPDRSGECRRAAAMVVYDGGGAQGGRDSCPAMTPKRQVEVER
ncbi:hypothetical protein JCM13210_13930 [Thermaerobacter litoralis]